MILDDQQQQQPESLLRELRQKALISFAEQTTAHGIMRLTQGSGLRRLVWGLAIVGACVGFSLHLAELAQRYLSYPVSTEFSNEGADFQFPTVTICPTNSFVYFCQKVDSNYSIPGRDRCLSAMIYDIPRALYQLLQEDWNVSMPTEAYSFYHDGKLSLRFLAYRGVLFQQPYETVIYCRYNSELCSFENFTIYKDEERFMCMSFNPVNRTVVRAGEGNGLYLVLVQPATTFLTNEEQIDNVPGFRIALHENGFKPDMTLSFNAPFGYKTSALMSSETDSKVNRESFPCSDDLPNVTYTMNFSYPGHFENQSFFGSTQDCLTRIMQEEFKNTCDCLGTHLALPSDLMNDTGVCHQLPEELFFRDIFYQQNSLNKTEYTITNKSWVNYPLTQYLQDNWHLYNRTAKLINCFRKVLHRHETQGVSSKRCPVRCSNTRYRVTTTLSAWPKDSKLAALALRDYAAAILTSIAGSGLFTSRLMDVYNRPSTMISNKYVSVLDLYTESTKASVFKESFAYQLRNLFSDLGGILGKNCNS